MRYSTSMTRYSTEFRCRNRHKVSTDRVPEVGLWIVNLYTTVDEPTIHFATDHVEQAVEKGASRAGHDNGCRADGHAEFSTIRNMDMIVVAVSNQEGNV